MGKVKDEAAAPKAKASKPAAGGKGGPKGGGRKPQGFVATLLSGRAYKPSQGWHARLWTGVGIGLLLVIGVWRLVQTVELGAFAEMGLGVGLLAAGGWATFRLVNHPPFADFLIATQAEMRKVSWISREDLKRASAVVLAVFVLMSAYLFAIDLVWSRLLQWIGVLGPGSSS